MGKKFGAALLSLPAGVGESGAIKKRKPRPKATRCAAGVSQDDLRRESRFRFLFAPFVGRPKAPRRSFFPNPWLLVFQRIMKDFQRIDREKIILGFQYNQ
ncbi:UNVERIFIED_CONTAM: hypothetical protein ABID98_005086 [Brevibacillus sp. OAP136]